MMVGNFIHAQTITGMGDITGNGRVYIDEYAYEKANGLIAAYRANQGVMLYPGTTNVYVWQDLSQNGYNLHTRAFPIGQTPVFHPNFGTNNIPVLLFDGTNDRIERNLLAPFFSGEDKPISMIGCAQSMSSAPKVIAGFGWSGATNNNASSFRLTPNEQAASLSFQLSSNTNSALVDVNSAALGMNTNVFFIQTATYTGTQALSYWNLSPGTLTTVDQGQRDLDYFTVGASHRNTTYAGFFNGGIFEVQIYTNSLSGPVVTNIVNRLNNRIPTGKIF